MRRLLSEHRVFAGIWLAIGLTRLAFTLAFPVVQGSDYAAYYGEGRGLAGLSSASLGLGNLGPKLFYGLVFRIFGDDLRVIGVANAVVYATAVLLIYLGALRTFSKATATATAGVCLVSLSELYFNNLACSEVLATFFNAATFFVMALELTGWRLWLALGAVGGGAAYVRSNTLAIFGLVLAYRWWRDARPGSALLDAAAVQAVVLLATLPLAFMHARVYGRFTPVAPGSAENLWYGNNPKLRGDANNYTQIPEELPVGGPRRKGMVEEYRAFYANPDPRAEIKRLGPYEASELKMRYALAWIRQNPGRYVELVVARFRMVFFHCTFGSAAYLYYQPSDPRQPRWSALARWAMLGSSPARIPDGPSLPWPRPMRAAHSYYQVLAFLAALGLAATALAERGTLRGSAKALPLMIVAFYALPFLLTLGLNRYKVPALSLLWVYLGHGLVLAGRKLGSQVSVVAEPRDGPAA